ncbi:hypothetical protein FDUTEX481_02083 [Tolypothrix sp. PCC 7601]|nr:hypothetical protein FDUTEX481_02083 [Tolypothrix sp. PCC 7601]
MNSKFKIQNSKLIFGVAYLRDEFRLLEKAESRFFAPLRLCVRQKSSHQSATPNFLA